MEEERSIHPIPYGDNPLEAARLMRDIPLAHYTFKIESFSVLSEMLSSTGVKKYESGDFEISGYKWRLSLYPDGDKKRNGNDHITLYLVLSETNTLPLGVEVNVFFKLFVYDQIRDKYSTFQGNYWFSSSNRGWGFPNFLPLIDLKDIKKGFIAKDNLIVEAQITLLSAVKNFS